MIKNRIK